MVRVVIRGFLDVCHRRSSGRYKLTVRCHHFPSTNRFCTVVSSIDGDDVKKKLRSHCALYQAFMDGSKVFRLSIARMILLFGLLWAYANLYMMPLP